MSRASGGTTTSCTWDVVGLPKLLQEGTNTYVYGLGLISTTDGSGNQTYPLHDGLGSTVALSNGSGTVTGTYAYDVFGAVRSHTGGSTEFSFTGELNDPNGYEYLRARYYDPAIGRFVSEDSWFALATVPTTLNRYTYANNNPVNATDPTGQECNVEDGDALSMAMNCTGGGGLAGGAAAALYLCNANCRAAAATLGQAIVKGLSKLAGKLGLGGGGDVRVTPPNPQDPRNNGLPQFRSEALLQEHFEEHGAGVGAATVDDYLSQAQQLITNPNVWTFVRGTDTLFFNPETNEFAVQAGDGFIRTYYIPDDGIQYWWDQIGVNVWGP